MRIGGIKDKKEEEEEEDDQTVKPKFRVVLKQHQLSYKYYLLILLIVFFKYWIQVGTNTFGNILTDIT